MAKTQKVAEYRDAKKKLAELRAEYKTIAKDAFKEEAKELFENNPNLIDFGFKCYTPYFNDGEPCVYRCSKGDPAVNGQDQYTGEEPEDPDKYPKLSTSEFDAVEKAVREFLRPFDKEDMMDLFGDHVSVCISRDGIEITEYDHD
jgi:hypothetical protein